MTISELLKDVYPQLSPGKRLIADYINENPDIAAYCTASAMAKSVGVSNAQIVKFVKTLGFESYKDLQDNIRGEVEQRVSLSSTLKSWRETEQSDMRANCMRIVNQDIDNIRTTFDSTDIKQLELIADRIVSAKRIGFVGARSANGCNLLPYIFIGEMRENVFLLSPGVNNTADVLKWWGPDDLVIGVSAFSYAQGFASEMLDYAHSNGCYTVWFTDSESFMQTPKKDYNQVIQFATRSAMLSLTSLVTIYNVIDYLVAARLSHSMEAISRTEQMLFRTWIDTTVQPPPGRGAQRNK